VAASPSSVEEWLRPFDRARTALFVRALEVRPLRELLLEKSRRISSLLLLHAGAAFLLAVFAPTLLLVLGPLLLGVPHVLSDVRYLLVRPKFRPPARVWLVGGTLALLALRLAAVAGVDALLRYELPLVAVWLAGSALFGAARLGDPRWLAVLLVASLLGWLGWSAPGALRLAMAHAHNFIAISLWALAFSSARGRALALLAVLSGAALLLAGSPLAWFGFQHGLTRSFGLHSFAAADQLAPFAQSTPLALGVVASFAFLQSVHYAVWLHAVPQESTRGEGTLSFRMTYRGLKAELGSLGLAMAALAVVVVPLCGLAAPLRTQSIYLSLASFHGYLELAVLSLWWVGRETAPSRRCC